MQTADALVLDRVTKKYGDFTAVDDLTSLDALLAGIPTDVRAAFSANTLGPLSDGSTSSHRVLLETLEAFLAHNCSWTRTAEALHLHRTSLYYRLNQVTEVTGVDLDDGGVRFRLQLALRLDGLGAAPG